VSVRRFRRRGLALAQARHQRYPALGRPALYLLSSSFLCRGPARVHPDLASWWLDLKGEQDTIPNLVAGLSAHDATLDRQREVDVESRPPK
jgi:hypothetical protein